MQNDIILIVHSLQSLLTEVLCITGNSPRPSLVLFRSMPIHTAVYHPWMVRYQLLMDGQVLTLMDGQ